MFKKISMLAIVSLFMSISAFGMELTKTEEEEVDNVFNDYVINCNQSSPIHARRLLVSEIAGFNIKQNEMFKNKMKDLDFDEFLYKYSG